MSEFEATSDLVKGLLKVIEILSTVATEEDLQSLEQQATTTIIPLFPQDHTKVKSPSEEGEE